MLIRKSLLTPSKTIPGDIKQLISQGKMYYNQKPADFEKALSYFQEVVKLNPKDFETYWYIGQCYRNLRKLPQHNELALEAFLQSAKINPNYFYAHNGVGLVNYTLGKYSEAIAAYTKANACMKHPAAYYYLALSYDFIGRPEEAYKNMAESATLGSYSNNVVARDNLKKKLDEIKRLTVQGASYYNQKPADFEKALPYFQEVVKLSPKAFEAYWYIGQCYRCLPKLPKHNELALEAFLQSAKINPNYFDAHNGTGYVYYAQGKYPEAVSAFTRAIACKAHPATYYYLALTYREMGKLDEAYKNMAKSAELNPKYADNVAQRDKLKSKLDDLKRKDSAEKLTSPAPVAPTQTKTVTQVPVTESSRKATTAVTLASTQKAQIPATSDAQATQRIKQQAPIPSSVSVTQKVAMSPVIKPTKATISSTSVITKTIAHTTPPAKTSTPTTKQPIDKITMLIAHGKNPSSSYKPFAMVFSPEIKQHMLKNHASQIRSANLSDWLTTQTKAVEPKQTATYSNWMPSLSNVTSVLDLVAQITEDPKLEIITAGLEITANMMEDTHSTNPIEKMSCATFKSAATIATTIIGAEITAAAVAGAAAATVEIAGLGAIPVLYIGTKATLSAQQIIGKLAEKNCHAAFQSFSKSLPSTPTTNTTLQPALKPAAVNLPSTLPKFIAPKMTVMPVKANPPIPKTTIVKNTPPMTLIPKAGTKITSPIKTAPVKTPAKAKPTPLTNEQKIALAKEKRQTALLHRAEIKKQQAAKQAAREHEKTKTLAKTYAPTLYKKYQAHPDDTKLYKEMRAQAVAAQKAAIERENSHTFYGSSGGGSVTTSDGSAVTCSGGAVTTGGDIGWSAHDGSGPMGGDAWGVLGESVEEKGLSTLSIETGLNQNTKFSVINLSISKHSKFSMFDEKL